MLLERLICALTRHRYIVERELSATSRKIGCTRCGRSWAMNDDARALVPWDADFDKLYADLSALAARDGRSDA